MADFTTHGHKDDGARCSKKAKRSGKDTSAEHVVAAAAVGSTDLASALVPGNIVKLILSEDVSGTEPPMVSERLFTIVCVTKSVDAFGNVELFDGCRHLVIPTQISLYPLDERDPNPILSLSPEGMAALFASFRRHVDDAVSVYRDFKKTAGSSAANISPKDVINFYFTMYLPAFSLWNFSLKDAATDVLSRVLIRSSCCRFDLNMHAIGTSIPAQLHKGYISSNLVLSTDMIHFSFIQQSIRRKIESFDIKREVPLQLIVDSGVDFIQDITSDVILLDKIVHTLPKSVLIEFVTALQDADVVRKKSSKQGLQSSGKIDFAVMKSIFKNHRDLFVQLLLNN